LDFTIKCPGADLFIQFLQLSLAILTVGNLKVLGTIGKKRRNRTLLARWLEGRDFEYGKAMVCIALVSLVPISNE